MNSAAYKHWNNDHLSAVQAWLLLHRGGDGFVQCSHPGIASHSDVTYLYEDIVQSGEDSSSSRQGKIIPLLD